MKDIKYKIQFYSPWHCGSGLSAGADIDTLVIKDKDGMPYIPGKTLKGLIREAVEVYAALTESLEEEDIRNAFGIPADPDDAESNISGSAFFTNAKLCEKETNAIVSDNAQAFLYNKVSSTAISDEGIALEHSLRRIETVVPCTLYAEIHNLPDNVARVLSKSLGLIHHIGVNRNRGLGRCDFKVEEGGGQ